MLATCNGRRAPSLARAVSLNSRTRACARNGFTFGPSLLLHLSSDSAIVADSPSSREQGHRYKDRGNLIVRGSVARLSLRAAKCRDSKYGRVRSRATYSGWSVWPLASCRRLLSIARPRPGGGNVPFLLLFLFPSGFSFFFFFFPFFLLFFSFFFFFFFFSLRPPGQPDKGVPNGRRLELPLFVE